MSLVGRRARSHRQLGLEVGQGGQGTWWSLWGEDGTPLPHSQNRPCAGGTESLAQG